MQIGLMIGTRHSGLMTLEFQVVIIAKHALIPLYSLLRFFAVAIHNSTRHLATQARRAHNQTLMMLGQLLMVGPRVHIEPVGPRFRHQFHQIVIAGKILRQHYQVPTAVVLVGMGRLLIICHIHLTTEYRHEAPALCLSNLLFQLMHFSLIHFFLKPLRIQLFAKALYLLFHIAVLPFHIVMKLLYAEHIAMVGQGHTAHPIGYGFIH